MDFCVKTFERKKRTRFQTLTFRLGFFLKQRTKARLIKEVLFRFNIENIAEFSSAVLSVR